MCFISVVMDDFNKRPEWQLIPNQVQTYPSPPIWNINTISKEDIDRLEKLVAEFKEAVVLANRLDILTKKPDCIDPEKAKLIDRVAELETQLEKIKQIALDTIINDIKDTTHSV